MLNEIIISGGHEFMKYLCILFNDIFDSKELPEEWSKGLIFPFGALASCPHEPSAQFHLNPVEPK